MMIDVGIHCVTKPGVNLFLGLGFSAAEAEKLHASPRKQINNTRLRMHQWMGQAIEMDRPRG